MSIHAPGDRKDSGPQRILSFFSDPRYGQNRRNLAAALGLTTIILIGGSVLMLLPRPPAKSDLAAGEMTAAPPSSTPTPTPGPSEAQILRQSALEALAINDGTTAETALRQAIKLEPDNPATWSNLGAALMIQDRSDEALEAMTQAIALDPELVRAYSNRAQIQRRLGRFPAAIADLRKASQIEPSDPVLSNRLLLLRIESGEIDSVRSEVRTSRSLGIPSLEKQSIIAEAAIASIDGDYPSAIALLARARELMAPSIVHDLLDDPVFSPHMPALVILPGQQNPQ